MNLNSFLKKGYKDSWDVLKKNQNYIWIAFAIFFLIAIFGFIFPIFFVDELNLIIQNMVLEFAGLNLFQTITKIFSNNFMASIYSIFLGLGFGIMPLFNSVLNGYLIGFVGNAAVAEGGFKVLLNLIPHGLFEIPAILISIGLGLFLGESFIKNVLKVKKSNLRKIILFGISVILIPLLIHHSIAILSIDPMSLTSVDLSDGASSIILVALINLTILVGMLFVAIYSFKNKKVKKDIKSVSKVLLFVVLPLLIIAAIIEGLFMFLF